MIGQDLGMPDSRCGDSQAVRSLTNVVIPIRFAMAAPIDLRNDFDSVSLRASRRGPGTRPRAVVCWRWPRSTMVPAGRMRRAIGGVFCRSFATGCCASTPADRTGWSMGSHRAPSKLNADHRRALAEVVDRPGPFRRSTASCAGGARTWRGGSWRRSPLARRDHGRARGRRASPRSRRCAPLRAGAGRRGFEKNFPTELAKIRARLKRKASR